MPPVATNGKKPRRSGSRAPVHPTTKAQRLTRVRELTERIHARQTEVDELSKERDRIVGELRHIDKATFREIGEASGRSYQSIHKAFSKVR